MTGRSIAGPAIVLAGLLLYLPSLDAPFIFDDHDAVVDNQSVRDLADLGRVLRPPKDTPVTGRPLLNLSFALSYALGTGPASFRAVSIALHLLNGLLLLALLRRLLHRLLRQLLRDSATDTLQHTSDVGAFAVALIFVLHPIQTEAVVYITQRSELLAATLCLATLLLAARSFEEGAHRLLAWAAVSTAALAPFVKETSAAIPLLVLVMDRALYSGTVLQALRQHGKLYAGLCLSIAATAVQLATWPRGKTAGFVEGSVEYLATQGAVLTHYLGASLWPATLLIVHDVEVADPIHRYLLQDGFIAALLLSTLWATARRPALSLPGWLFFAWLAPSSSVIPVLSEVAAERRMYLPLVAVLCSVAVFAYLLGGRIGSAPLRRWLPGVLLALCALACAVRSSQRLGDYQTRRSIWQSAVDAEPNNRPALRGLALARAEDGDRQGAIELLTRLTRDHRPFRGPASWGARAWMAIADIHADAGNDELARAARLRGMEHEPSSALGRLYAGSTLLQAGELERAEKVFVDMLEQPFMHDRAHQYLGAIQYERGNLREAARHTQLALDLEPDNEGAQRMRALLLSRAPR